MGVLEREYMRRDVDEDGETFRPLWSVTEEQLGRLAQIIDEMTMPMGNLSWGELKKAKAEMSDGGKNGRKLIEDVWLKLLAESPDNDKSRDAACYREATRQVIAWAVLAWLRTFAGIGDDEG